MKVTLTKAAEQDIDDAAFFFEERNEGFGEKFYRRVDQALGKIELNPTGFQTVHKDIRRVQLEQFKEWGLWFYVEPDGAVVILCASGKRHPAVAKDRRLGVIPMRPPQP